jgi:hypothetical protein
MVNMNKIILFSISVFILLLASTASHAVIQLRENGVQVSVFNTPNQTQRAIGTSAGEAGDFELLMCATRSDGSNFFLDATPGWTTLDSGECGGSGGCILGIFTRTDDSPAETVNNCLWVDPTNMGGAGSFRYSGVDPEDFFINVSCNTGTGGTPFAPSIPTSSNSAVVRVATSGGFIIQQFVDSEQVVEGGFGFGASGDGEFITGRGLSFAFEDFGPTGVFEFDPTTGDWRACTIAFGPELNIGTIPTLSEWGLGIFAALFGIAAVWALRRRAVRA